MKYCNLVIFGVILCTTSIFAKTVTAIERLCTYGDLYQGINDFRAIKDDALALHSLAALELILNANVDSAVALQKLGKATDFTAIPPLAKRHLDGIDCAGLGDLFYVSAVIIKELVDTNKALPNVLKALKTLVTLTSDSGLPHAGEALIQTAIALDPHDASLRFRAAVMTPGVYESIEHINVTRALLTKRIEYLSDPKVDLALTGLDEFVMSPTFYFVYQGYNDRHLLTALQRAYAKAYPKLSAVEILSKVRNKAYLYQLQGQRPRKIRVGFVSSHFRRHSICKLFCGIMTNLDPSLYEVYAFSSLQQNLEDKVTQSLRQSHINFVSIGMTFIQNRNEVVDRNIDILVSLCATC
jgi:predicted O-linked N-acetylglucosamine transferase (SPINDLY family)